MPTATSPPPRRCPCIGRWQRSSRASSPAVPARVSLSRTSSMSPVSRQRRGAAPSSAPRAQRSVTLSVCAAPGRPALGSSARPTCTSWRSSRWASTRGSGPRSTRSTRRSCPADRRADRPWLWPPTRPTWPSARTPAVPCAFPPRAAAWRPSRRRTGESPPAGGGHLRPASTPSDRWPETSTGSPWGCSFSSPASHSAVPRLAPSAASAPRRCPRSKLRSTPLCAPPSSRSSTSSCPAGRRPPIRSPSSISRSSGSPITPARGAGRDRRGHRHGVRPGGPLPSWNRGGAG